MSPYVVEEKPFEAGRKLRVVVIGAGFSGIYLGIRIPQVFGDKVDLTIVDKNPGVGGTWWAGMAGSFRLLGGSSHCDLENKYPGCACDVPAHRYCYTFENNYDFPNYYSDSDAIEQYLIKTWRKYGVDKYTKLNTAVTKAVWNEETGKWDVAFKGPEGEYSDSYEVLINGTGILNSWKYPNIEGIKDFKGKLLHTAAYDRSIPIEGKKVAVIGTGSSGIQVVAAIASKVERLGVYIRSPTWIVPPFNIDLAKKKPDGTPDLTYTEEDKERFRNDPQYFTDLRRKLEMSQSQLFTLLDKNGAGQAKLRPMLEKQMRDILQVKPGLAEHLIPKFAVGCRRYTPGIGYLESLVRPNVDCILGGIKKITPDGIIDDFGNELKYDVIICATGFDVSFQSRFPFIGRNGRQLDAEFGKNPKAYLSLAYAGFPNSWVFNGPGSPVGNGSVIPAIESQGEYILQCLDKISKHDVKSIAIKDEVVEELATHSDVWMQRMVWTDSCRSWYKNHTTDGRVVALHPGTAFHFNKAIETPRFEDYDFTYTNPLSRFSYLGNGQTWGEINLGPEVYYEFLEKRQTLTQDHPALKAADTSKL